MERDLIRAALVTGTLGSGKTAVVVAATDLLVARGDDVAVVDLDWLGWANLPGAEPDELIERNLAAIWPNLRDAGARYLLMSRALTSTDQVDLVRRALPGVELQTVIVESDPELVEERLRKRDTGKILAEHLVETGEMRSLQNSLGLDAVTIENDDRPIRAVAEELLGILGWA